MIDSLCIRRALRINGIPRTFGKSDEYQLKNLFEELVGKDEVLSVKIILDYKEMYQLILDKNTVLEKLERAKKANVRGQEREMIRKGCCCCKRYVDAESEYTRELERIQSEEQSVTSPDSNRTNIGSAFIIFKSAKTASAAKSMVSRRFYLAPRYARLGLQDWEIRKAPPPTDILWANIGITSGTRKLIFFSLNIPLCLITILMTVPITVTSFFHSHRSWTN